jgi:hypothetical protein
MVWFSKLSYNKRSSKKHGWKPSWFGLEDFCPQLIERIKLFQVEWDLKPDGLVGPLTYRRLFTAKEAKNKSKNSIICNGMQVPIAWDKVKIDMMDRDCYKRSTKARYPNMIVTHWDVCLSADSCKRVLEKRNISTHFCIDNDGTIVQLVDCNDVAWHAGIRRVNNNSIGVDLSNAYYTRYQKTYIDRGHGARPILKDSIVHGRKLSPHLGFYPVQIEAYKALLDALLFHYKIAEDYPREKFEELKTTVDKDAARGKFNGVVCHYHVTKRKIDTAGLKLDEIINDLKEYPVGSKD